VSCFAVDSGIPSSPDRLCIDFCGDLATVFSTSLHCHPLGDSHRVLGLSFMLSVAKSLCCVPRSVCFLAAGNRYALGLLSPLIAYVSVSRH
jgi:hypothetical protein